MSGYFKLTGATLPAGPSYPTLFNFLSPLASLPNVTNLKSLVLLGGNSAYCLRNKVSGQPDISLIGSPTISTVGASCTASACFDSGQPETTAFTLMVVAKPIASGSGMLIADYNNTDNKGSSLYFGGTTTVDLATGTSGANANTSLSLGSPTAADWYTFSAKGDATNQALAFRHNGSLTRSSTTSTGSRDVKARNLRIGGNYSSSFADPVNVAMALIFDAKLSDTDEANTMAAIASVMNTYAGITTL